MSSYLRALPVFLWIRNSPKNNCTICNGFSFISSFWMPICTFHLKMLSQINKFSFCELWLKVTEVHTGGLSLRNCSKCHVWPLPPPFWFNVMTLYSITNVTFCHHHHHTGLWLSNGKSNKASTHAFHIFININSSWTNLTIQRTQVCYYYIQYTV